MRTGCGLRFQTEEGKKLVTGDASAVALLTHCLISTGEFRPSDFSFFEYRSSEDGSVSATEIPITVAPDCESLSIGFYMGITRDGVFWSI